MLFNKVNSTLIFGRARYATGMKYRVQRPYTFLINK